MIVVAALAVVLLTRGGSSGSKAGESSAATGSTAAQTTSHHKHSTKAPAPKPVPTTPPAELSVVVLNGTETTGLATRAAGELQQGGYSQAAAKYGRPPGANEVTIVEYAPGQQPDAQEVARSLSVSHVEPMEQAVLALAGPAKVVVVVGADRASQTTSAP